MKHSVIVLLVAALAVLGSAHVYGHHSAAAAYKVLETITIEEELVELTLRNPHSWVYVMARDAAGKETRWGVEWGGSGQLARQGASNGFKVGDKVVITGRPARNPRDHRMLMRTIVRPSDGFSWGNRPGEAVEGVDQ